MKAQRSDLPRVSFLLPDSFPPLFTLPNSFPPSFILPNSFLPSTRQPLPQPRLQALYTWSERGCWVCGLMCVLCWGGLVHRPPQQHTDPPAAHRPPSMGRELILGLVSVSQDSLFFPKWMNRNNQISQFQPLICHFSNFVFKIRFKIHYLQTVSYFKMLNPSFV